MRDDPELFAETLGWLHKARDDLEASRRCLEDPVPLCAVTAFLAQQAVEKALKAFLTFHQVDFEKTHNLDVLGQKCVANKCVACPDCRSSRYAYQICG